MKAKPVRPASRTHTHGLSRSASRMLQQADAALGRMQLDEAERALFGVLALAPDCAQANRLMGVVLQIRGEHVHAVEFLQRAVAASPDDSITHMNLGTALFEVGAFAMAFASLRRACELAPDAASTWYNLGKALKLQAHYDEARAAFEQALTADSAHVMARIGLADALTGLGDIAEAKRNYRIVLRQHPEQPQAWFSLSNLKTEPFSAADVAVLTRAFQRTNTAADARIYLGFALAKAIEDQGNYPAAFEMLQQANALKRHSVRWNAGAERAHVQAIEQAFAKPLPGPLDPALGAEALFIVSLPRSGSTLVEQILASHPQVEGANEITDLPQIIEDESKRRRKPFPIWVSDATAEDWDRLGRDYLSRTARWRLERPRFVDKNLVTWQLVGAIRAMLPGAKIIDCRRDPLETCFACYRQLFSSGAHFSYDLEEMAFHYMEYDRLMEHWHAQFPNAIFRHSHEDLLVAPETCIRDLLDFCELPFSETCLTPHLSARAVRSTASAAQVRQPLRSTGILKSTRYSGQLALTRRILRAAGCLT